MVRGHALFVVLLTLSGGCATKPVPEVELVNVLHDGKPVPVAEFEPVVREALDSAGWVVDGVEPTAGGTDLLVSKTEDRDILRVRLELGVGDYLVLPTGHEGLHRRGQLADEKYVAWLEGLHAAIREALGIHAGGDAEAFATPPVTPDEAKKPEPMRNK